MGLLERLRAYLHEDAPSGSVSEYPAPATARSEDQIAVERYRYLLRTAPPDTVEEVHAEAFATLTPQQRRLVFEELSRHAAAADRPASGDPRTLARSATRSELRQPGFLERTFGSDSRDAGLGTVPGGAVLGGALLGTVAGVVIGSAIADMVLPGIGDIASDGSAGGDDDASGFGDFGGEF